MRNAKRPPLTPEQEEADRRYLERILRIDPELDELLKQIPTEDLLRF